MEDFKTWWKKNKKAVLEVAFLGTILVGGIAAYAVLNKRYDKKTKEIMDSVPEMFGVHNLPKPDIEGCYIHEFWCENAEPGTGMGVKAIIAVDPEVADVSEVFKKLAEAGNVDTDLNGFWATVEWDCND